MTVEEVAAPSLSDGEVRLRIASAGICGSDVHGLAGVNGRRQPGTVLGHELAGRVIESGTAVDPSWIGRQVAVDPVVGCGSCAFCAAGEANLCLDRGLYGCVPWLEGGMATTMAVRASNLVPVSDDISADVAALAEPLAVGQRGVNLLGEIDGQQVLVLGGGMIGLGAAIAARRAGAVVRLVEPLAHRQAVAAGLGIDLVAAAADAAPVDAVLDCVAVPATIADAVAAVRPAGTIVVVGLGQPEVPLPVIPVVVGERIVRGSSAYARRDFEQAVATLHEEAGVLAQVVERRIGLEQVADTLARYHSGELQAVKTIVDPWEGSSG